MAKEQYALDMLDKTGYINFEKDEEFGGNIVVAKDVSIPVRYMHTPYPESACTTSDDYDLPLKEDGHEFITRFCKNSINLIKSQYIYLMNLNMRF